MMRFGVAAMAAWVCRLSFGAAGEVDFYYAKYPDANIRVNRDEARVAPYELEDPLVFVDGRKVETAADWVERRAEILEIFEREMYGKRPPAPDTLVADLVDEKTTFGGKVLRRQHDMYFRADRSGPKIRWITFIPKEAPKPAPVILFLNYHGNQSLVYDPDIPMMTAWHRNGRWAKDNRVLPETRGLCQRPQDSDTAFPLDEFVRRGYAVMSACYCEVSPDPNRIGDEDPRPMQDSLAYTGVFDLWPKRNPWGMSETTSLGAWSWALSRGLDLAGRQPEIDAKKSVVTGCSRLGKAALIATAYDERFAVCVPVQTGNGGAPLAKRDFGENPATETRQFTHWFCRAYAVALYRDVAVRGVFAPAYAKLLEIRLQLGVAAAEQGPHEPDAADLARLAHPAERYAPELHEESLRDVVHVVAGRDRVVPVLRLWRRRAESGRFVVRKRRAHLQDGQQPQGRNRHALVAQPRIPIASRPERDGKGGIQVDPMAMV